MPPRGPENLTRTSPSLKMGVMLATIDYIADRHSFTSKAPRRGDPDIEEYSAYDIQMPNFVASRLPPPEPTSYGLPGVTNNLLISEQRPANVAATVLCFVGRISLIRSQLLVDHPGPRRQEWIVSYAVNSLRRSLIRLPILGQVATYNNEGERTSANRLLDQEKIVQADFPQLFATTEAWQLIQLYKRPKASLYEDLGAPGLGSIE